MSNIQKLTSETLNSPTPDGRSLTQQPLLDVSHQTGGRTGGAAKLTGRETGFEEVVVVNAMFRPGVS